MSFGCLAPNWFELASFKQYLISLFDVLQLSSLMRSIIQEVRATLMKMVARSSYEEQQEVLTEPTS